MLSQFYFLLKISKWQLTLSLKSMFSPSFCLKYFFILSYQNLICLRYTRNDTNLLIYFLIFSLWNVFSISDNYRLMPVLPLKSHSMLYCFVLIYLCHILPFFCPLFLSFIQYSTLLLEIELLFFLTWQSSLILWILRMDRFKSVRVFSISGQRNWSSGGWLMTHLVLSIS